MKAYNLAAIARKAHQIAATCEGDRAARLALGFQQAWAEAKTPKADTFTLRALGDTGKATVEVSCQKVANWVNEQWTGSPNARPVVVEAVKADKEYIEANLKVRYYHGSPSFSIPEGPDAFSDRYEHVY